MTCCFTEKWLRAVNRSETSMHLSSIKCGALVQGHYECGRVDILTWLGDTTLPCDSCCDMRQVTLCCHVTHETVICVR